MLKKRCSKWLQLIRKKMGVGGGGWGGVKSALEGGHPRGWGGVYKGMGYGTRTPPRPWAGAQNSFLVNVSETRANLLTKKYPFHDDKLMIPR